jgi:hypothetical protein
MTSPRQYGCAVRLAPVCFVLVAEQIYFHLNLFAFHMLTYVYVCLMESILMQISPRLCMQYIRIRSNTVYITFVSSHPFIRPKFHISGWYSVLYNKEIVLIHEKLGKHKIHTTLIRFNAKYLKCVLCLLRF